MSWTLSSETSCALMFSCQSMMMPVMDGLESTRNIRLWETKNRRRPAHIVRDIQLSVSLGIKPEKSSRLASLLIRHRGRLTIAWMQEWIWSCSSRFPGKSYSMQFRHSYATSASASSVALAHASGVDRTRKEPRDSDIGIRVDLEVMDCEGRSGNARQSG